MYRLQQAVLAVDHMSYQVYRVAQNVSCGLRTTQVIRQDATEIKGTPYSKMSIGVIKESFAKEKRVALSPGMFYNRLLICNIYSNLVIYHVNAPYHANCMYRLCVSLVL